MRERLKRLARPPVRRALRGGFELAVAIERRLRPQTSEPTGATVSAPPTKPRRAAGATTLGIVTDDVAGDLTGDVTGDVTGEARSSLQDKPRIVLLNPPRYRGIPVVRLYRSEYLYVQGQIVPPMDLAYFSAVCRGDAITEIVDAQGEDLDLNQTVQRIDDFKPDIIVVRGVLNLLEEDLAAAKRHKDRHPHVRVVLNCRGAVDSDHVVFERHDCVDGIARGEVDAFAEDLAAGMSFADIDGMSTRDRPSSEVRVVEDLDAHPMPDVAALPRIWYDGYRLPYYGVDSGYFLITSRGCPYSCSYCMVGGIDDRPFRYRRRDPQNVAEEVRYLRTDFGIRDFYVFDEIFTMPGHGERVAELFARDSAETSFVCEGKPDLVSPAMLESFRKAGCRAIYYGIESGDDSILRDVNKGHTVGDARRALQLTREAGICSGAYVMLGFPNETVGTFLRTMGFLLETRPDLVRYDFLLPYPVTMIHAEMMRSGLLDFEPVNLDRRISPLHDADISIRSRHLGAKTLRTMDFLMRHTFARELVASPP